MTASRLEVPMGPVRSDSVMTGDSVDSAGRLAGRRDSAMTGDSVDSAVRLAGRRDKWRERLNTELLRAVVSGDEEKVNRLLETGASPLARCRGSGASAAHIAAGLGHTSLLGRLTEASSSVPLARDRQGRQPHHLAAAAGRTQALVVLLAACPQLIDSRIAPGPAPDLPQGSLDSWNHDHAQFDNLVPQASGIGKTSLHLASEAGDWEMVGLLLASGACPTTPDMLGLSPLDVAGRQWRARPPSQSDGRNAFHVLTADVPEAAPVEPVERVCTLLMEKGAEFPRSQVIVKEGEVINQRRMRVTALHTAVARGDSCLARFLLSRGACSLTWDEEGLTAVHLAVRARSGEALEAMLEAGPALEARDVRGRTPLLQAVEEGWTDGVALLLEAGADLFASSNTNQTVLHLAAVNGSAPILEELLSIPDISKILDRTNGSYETPLCVAVRNQQEECVRLLCDHGADAGFLLLPGDESLLHLAVRTDSVQSLRVLLSGAGRTRVDLATREERGGVTPIHIAAAEGRAECAEELLAAGADLRARTRRGDTALHLAARNGHARLVELLVRRDSEAASATNSDGWTPLHVAAAEGHSACAKTMVLHGADLSATVTTELGERSVVDFLSTSLPKADLFLEEAFDDFVEVVKGPVSDPDCEILLTYDVLMPSGDNEKQMRVICAIMNCDRQTVKDRIMLHPLINTFIYLKWMKFRIFFIFLMFLYFLLTISLTTVAHMTFLERNTTNLYKAVSIIARMILFVVLVPIILVELVNLCQMERHYFFDYESWVKWTVIGCTCAVESVSPDYGWVRYLASVAVLLSWVEMLFLLSHCPSWGFYVLMFSRVSIRISKILATFSFLILGFAFSFMILFEAKVPFRNMMESVVKVLVMMIEFDYEDMFSENSEGHGRLFSVVGRLLFAVFVLLVAMVMMNLIVGVAVSDIGRLESQGRTQQLLKQAAFLSFLEEFLYSRRLAGKGLPSPARRLLQGRKAVPRTLLIRPSKPNHSELPRAQLEWVLYNVQTRRPAPEPHLADSLRELSDGMDRIAAELEELRRQHARRSPAARRDSRLDRLLESIVDEQRALREHVSRSARRTALHQGEIRARSSTPQFI